MLNYLSQALGPQSMQTMRAHEMEVLTLDWNKYMENVIFTGSVDRTIKMWDLRNPGRPMGGMPPGFSHC